VDTFKPGTLTLSIPAGSQTLKIEGVGSHSNIRGVDPREYPVIPGIEETENTPLVVNAGGLKKMIEQVVFAAERDSSKPVWSSVKIEVSENALALVAADTLRLARRANPFPPEVQAQPLAILIPGRCLHELARILPAMGLLKIMVTPRRNQVVFRLEQGMRVDFVSRLVEGTYPAYQKVIPTEHRTRAVVDTTEFIGRLEQAAIFATDTSKCVRVTFKTAQNGGLVIESDNPDAGNNVGSVAAEITGQEQQILFNVQYLLEALSHIDTPQVALLLIASGRPVLLKPMADLDYVNMVQTILPPSNA
jgi:DNA polymerase-3 subunit beta